MLKFHEKTSQAVGASLNSLAKCDTKCPLIGFVRLCERKKDLGGRGCVDSAFPGVLPEFLSPAHSVSMSSLGSGSLVGELLDLFDPSNFCFTLCESLL